MATGKASPLNLCEGCGVPVQDNEPYTKIAAIKYRRMFCPACYHELNRQAMSSANECAGCLAIVPTQDLQLHDVGGKATYFCSDCCEIGAFI
jgi:hypothetical protein